MADLDMRALLTDGRGLRHFLIGLVFLSGCCLPAGSPLPSSGIPVVLPQTTKTTPGLTPATGTTLTGPMGTGCRATRRIEDRAKVREIPQIDGAYELFGDLAGAAVDPAVGGVLVCDLRLPGTPWYKSRPDMQARLTIAGGPGRTLVGHDNRDEVVVTAPLDRIASGDTITLAVEDRDLLSRNDPIDSATGSFNGVFPLLLTGAGRELHVICQHQTAAATAAEMPPLLSALSSRVSAYDTAAQTLDRGAQDFGFPWAEREAAERAVEEVVARVGWGDPRVGPPRQQLTATETSWDTAVRADVASISKGAAPQGSGVMAPGGPIRVTVGTQACGTAASSMVVAAGGSADLAPNCVLELGVHAVGPAVHVDVPPDGVAFHLPGGAAPELVMANGWTQGLSIVPSTATSGPIAPGQSQTLLLRADSLCYDFQSEPLKDAVLLRLTGAAPGWMKVR